MPLLETVRTEMRAPNEVLVVNGGDHSLLLTKSRLRASNQTQEEVDQHILERIRSFLAGLE